MNIRGQGEVCGLVKKCGGLPLGRAVGLVSRIGDGEAWGARIGEGRHDLIRRPLAMLCGETDGMITDLPAAARQCEGRLFAVMHCNVLHVGGRAPL